MNWLFVGSLFSFLSVVLGAFGAHFLKSRLSEYSIGIFNTAVQYQFFHAVAILVVSLLIANELQNKTFLDYSAIFFLVGIIIFSGSLYLLALTGVKWLGAITPIGGLAFLIGWSFLIYCSFSSTTIK